MVQEIDIYRTAQVIIDQYGEDAVLEAMKRIDKYLERNNANGAILWNRIADAILTLQMPENLIDATVH
jgi:hypothetical protein